MVRVQLPGGGVALFGPPVRDHAEGVSWRITRKGRLLVLAGDGREVARYKPMTWVAVWWVAA